MNPESATATAPPLPRSKNGRTAVLGVCLAFAAGGVCGSVSGFFVGRAGDALAEEQGKDELAHLHWLATEASTDELVAQAWHFLLQLHCNYSADEALWHGLERLAYALPERGADKEARRIARFAEQVLQGARDTRPADVDALLQVLGGVR